MGDFSRSRVRLSNLGRGFSRLIGRHDLSDPMSGFFMLTRTFLNEAVHNISGTGFKILLDIVASSPRPVRIEEVPYCFGERIFGESKLDILVGLNIHLILDKSLGRYVPVRFIVFAVVGGLGVVLHPLILYTILLSGRCFAFAQMAATLVVMTFNFLLNNTITYRDRRLRGTRIIIYLITFYLAYLLGAFVNVRAAGFMVANGWPWHVAGLLDLILGSV